MFDELVHAESMLPKRRRCCCRKQLCCCPTSFHTCLQKEDTFRVRERARMRSVEVCDAF